MPRDFTAALDSATPRDMPTTFDPDTSWGEALGTIGKWARDSAEAKNAAASEQAVADFALEAQGVVQESSGYTAAFNDLQRAISVADPKDQATLTGLQKQMDALTRGEMQGALSPQGVQTRLNVLTRNYLTRFPQLTNTIINMRNMIGSNIKATAGLAAEQEDPMDKGVREVNLAAATKGITPKEELRIRQVTAANELQNQTFEMQMRIGGVTLDQIQKNIADNASAVYQTKSNELVGIMNNPNFTVDLATRWYTAAAGDIERNVRAKIADIRATYNTNIPIEREQQIVDTALAPMKSLMDLAKTADTPQKRLEIKKIMLDTLAADASLEAYKRLGPIAALAKNSDDLLSIVDFVSKISDQVRKGQLPELENLAQYDLKTRMVLDHIKSNRAETDMLGAVGAASQGQDIKPTGLPLIDQMNFKAAIDAGLRPGISLEQQRKYMEAAARNPEVFSALERMSNFRNTMALHPTAVTMLETNGTAELMRLVEKLSPTQFNSIQFNPNSTSAPFSAPTAAVSLGTGGVPGGDPTAMGFGVGVRGSAPYLMQATVDTLNRTWGVLSNYASQSSLAEKYRKVMDQAGLYLQLKDQPHGMDNFLELSRVTSKDAQAEAGLQEELEAESSQQAFDSDIINNILRREGSTYTEDSGGPTKFGITIPALKDFRGEDVSAEDIKKLTEEEARDIYHKEYVQPFRAVSNPALHEAIVDAGVNHGVPTAKRWLKIVEKLPVLEAVRKLTDIRRGEYLRLARQNAAKYGPELRGWLNRINQLERNLFDQLLGESSQPVPPLPPLSLTKVEPGLYLDEKTGRYLRVDELGGVGDALVGENEDALISAFAD